MYSLVDLATRNVIGCASTMALDAILKSDLVLTEGSMFEALRRDPKVTLHPVLAHSTLVYQESGRTALKNLWQSFINVAQKNSMPMLVFTATWRANSVRLKKTEFEAKAVNEDNVVFLKEVCASYGPFAKQISIGGLMGCVGDAYKPEEALSEWEAEKVHDMQAAQLADAGVDFLFGSTLPAFSEALGLARSMAKTKKPYVLSFVIRRNGTLLDGMPLSKVFTRIDAETSHAPAFYMVNCVHPEVLQEALRADSGMVKVAGRLLGLQANTSSLSPEALADAKELLTEASDSFGYKMAQEGKANQLRVLGGCCGADPSHIEAIATFARIKK